MLDSMLLSSVNGLVMPLNTLLALGQPDVMLTAKAPVDEVDTIGDVLMLPNVTPVTSVDVNNLLTRTVRNLFIFAVGMAGFALVAGLVLIANAAGLNMLDRRYEIAMLKAVGYTGRHIQRVIWIEYGLLGLFTGIAGLIATQVFILVLGAADVMGSVVILLNPITALLILAFAILMTCTTAWLTVWQAVQVRPMLILREGR
jgi:putative ABC transport system permease protein